MGLSDEEFDAIVGDAVDSLPDDVLDQLDNVVITVEDDSRGVVDPEDGDGMVVASGEVLGLYSGVPLTERGFAYGGALPDVITIYKRPHERCFPDRDELVEQVRETVIHEVGHYFGMDEEQVREMGY